MTLTRFKAQFPPFCCQNGLFYEAKGQGLGNLRNFLSNLKKLLSKFKKFYMKKARTLEPLSMGAALEHTSQHSADIFK